MCVCIYIYTDSSSSARTRESERPVDLFYPASLSYSTKYGGGGGRPYGQRQVTNSNSEFAGQDRDSSLGLLDDSGLRSSLSLVLSLITRDI